MLTEAIDTIMNAMFNNSFAGQTWIMYLIVIMGSLMLITRKFQDWATLALPIMIGWKYFGVDIPLVFLVTGAVIFIVDILSLRMIGGAFSGLGEFASKEGRIRGKIRRLNVQEEMEKYKYRLENKEDEAISRDLLRKREKANLMLKQFNQPRTIDKDIRQADIDNKFWDRLKSEGNKADIADYLHNRKKYKQKLKGEE